MARTQPNGSLFTTLLADHAHEIDDAIWVLHHSSNSLIALRAIGELRRHAVEAERILVNEARANGDTWEMIAEALGESRQAVHRRHARRSTR